MLMKKNKKEHSLGIILFAFTEILIGAVTLNALLSGIILGNSQKPPEVFVFIFCTSLISVGLGLGILKYSPNAYHLLLFFSAVIILSKVLIFAKIISLNEVLETAVPASLKNITSIIYHSIIILYFKRKKIEEQFGKHHNNIFFLKN